jgi:hypothetical protein
VALDAFIRDAVLSRLEAGGLTDKSNDTAPNQTAELLVQHETHATRLNGLLDDYTDGTLTKAQYVRAKTRVEAALDDVTREIESLHRSRLNVELERGETLRDAWNRNPDAWRRQLIGRLVERVAVNPSSKKPLVMVDNVRMRFDAEAIGIVWQQ